MHSKINGRSNKEKPEKSGSQEERYQARLLKLKEEILAGTTGTTGTTGNTGTTATTPGTNAGSIGTMPGSNAYWYHKGCLHIWRRVGSNSSSWVMCFLHL